MRTASSPPRAGSVRPRPFQPGANTIVAATNRARRERMSIFRLGFQSYFIEQGRR